MFLFLRKLETLQSYKGKFDQNSRSGGRRIRRSLRKKINKYLPLRQGKERKYYEKRI